MEIASLRRPPDQPSPAVTTVSCHSRHAFLCETPTTILYSPTINSDLNRNYGEGL